MEKIMLAINSSPINKQTIDFACYLATLTHSRLHGIFFEDLEGEPLPRLKNVYGAPFVETVVTADIPENKIRVEQLQHNKKMFEMTCSNKGIKGNYTWHNSEALEDIITETRFADLLVTDAEFAPGHKTSHVLNSFLKKVLAKSECPVLIAPYEFEGIDEIVFAYDGSPSSVFAIKQFTYLFPQLSDKRCIIVQVNKREDMPLVEKEKINELLSLHYSSIGYHFLKGKASEELLGYMLKRKGALLVMGAFGRSLLSGFFKSSTSEDLIRTANLPIFITH